jgi:hypothetical protein
VKEMRIEGVIFKNGEIPKTLFKIVSGTVRETRNNTYHDLTKGEYVALLEYLLGLPLEDDIIALEETELVETDTESDYENIIRNIVALRKIIYQTSVDFENLVLDDFNFETENIDEYLNQIESLLTLSGGELPEDKEKAIELIESLEEDKLFTKVNLVKKFVERFPEEQIGAKFLIETAAKVYIVLNDRYVAKAFRLQLRSGKNIGKYIQRRGEHNIQTIWKNGKSFRGDVTWKRLNLKMDIK